MRNYLKLGLTLLLGSVLLVTVLLATQVSADELSPPYVIVLRPWSFDAQAAATLPSKGLAYIVAQKGVAVFQGLELTGTIDIGSAKDVGVDTKRGYVYVTRDGTAITVLSGTARLADISIGAATDAVAVLTTTGDAYVAQPANDKVTILQTSGAITPSVVKSINVGAAPSDIAVDPHSGYVYVANYDGNDVTVINGATRTVVDLSVPVGDGPAHVAANPVSGYVYVSNSRGNSVSILQGTTVKATVTISEPGEIAVNSRNGHVYVLSSYTRDLNNPQGWVEVFSGTTHLRQIPLPHDARAIAVNPNSGYVYVSNGSDQDGAVTVLSDTLVMETFPMGQTAFDVAVDPQADLAYVPIYNGHVAVFGRTVVYATDPLSPTSPSATLHCLNTQAGHNLPITMTIPAGGVPTTNTRILCTPLMEVEGAPDYVWARQGFRLFAAQDNINLPDFTFSQPVTTAFSYLETLPAPAVEDELEFHRRVWQGVSNVWHWPTSGIAFLAQDQPHNVYTVTLDRVGEYALVWFKPHAYLPVVMKSP